MLCVSKVHKNIHIWRLQDWSSGEVLWIQVKADDKHFHAKKNQQKPFLFSTIHLSILGHKRTAPRQPRKQQDFTRQTNTRVAQMSILVEGCISGRDQDANFSLFDLCLREFES